MSFAEGLRLTRISSKEPGGVVQLKFRPEGIYRGSGKTWGFSTVDLSFAVHNGQVHNGQYLDLTSELVQSDGTIKVLQETLVYIKQDEKLPSKGEWGPHYFIRPESIGKGEPEILARGKEVSSWRSSNKEVSQKEAGEAGALAQTLAEKRLSTNPFKSSPKPL